MVPSLDDFKSAKALGKPLHNPALEREWAEGGSVYDDLQFAMERARKARFMLGRYVVAVRIPDDSTVEIRQTTRNPRHYTMYGPPDRLLALTDSDPISVMDGA